MRLNPEEYINKCWDKARFYIEGVLDGTIIANKYIKLAIERHLRELKREDLEIRYDKIERVFEFFSYLNVNNDSTIQQFDLLPYQVFFIITVFGFYKKGTDKRIRQTAFLFIGRGNGKTTFAAGLQLYGLMFDGQLNPECLLIANKREQAKDSCLKSLTEIINLSPVLAKRLDPQNYTILFKDRRNLGFSKTLPFAAKSLDGFKTNFAILDEIHAYSDDSVYNVIASSCGKKKNSLILMLSTAGFTTDSFCTKFLAYCKSVLKDDLQDDSLAALVYELDDNDDISDPNNWHKPNPAMGYLMTIDWLKTQFSQSSMSATQMNNFATKHLNIFTESSDPWIEDEYVNNCCKKVDEEKIAKKTCFVGLDLSSVKDLTAIVCLFKDEKIEHFYVKPYFLIPNNPKAFLRKNKLDLRKWIDEGHIIMCPTPSIDYPTILKVFSEIAENYDLRITYYDPFGEKLLIPELQKMGIFCKPFRQTAMNFTDPINQLYRVISDGNIDLSDNPCMKWNIKNTFIQRWDSGNQKFSKNKSLDSIDGTVALGMAMGGFIEDRTDSLTLTLEANN